MNTHKLLSLFDQPRVGVLLLRWSLALLMLPHGVAKLSNGVDGIAGMLQSMGLPGFLAYGVYLGEVVAPLFLLLGRFVVPAALVIAINMVFAVDLAHLGQFWTLGKSGGWALELQAFFFITAVVVALTARSRPA